MNSRRPRIFLGMILLVILALACASPFASAPSPTPIPQDAFRQTLDASIMSTAAAAQTQTEVMRPPTLTPTLTRTPSKTPTQMTPSPTFIFSLFSATPTVDIPVEATNAALNATATQLRSQGILNLWGSTFVIEKMWACHVRYSPNLKVKPREEFYASWEVANIGAEPWTSNTVDFIYKGGYKHDSTRIQDLRSTVGSGSVASIGAVFTAPNRTGEYRGYYVLKVGNNEFCPMWIDFVVTNK